MPKHLKQSPKTFPPSGYQGLSRNVTEVPELPEGTLPIVGSH